MRTGGNIAPTRGSVNTFACHGIRERLAELAKKQGSHRALARKVGVPQQMISRYISGQDVPGVEAAARIARAAGVSLDWLLTGEGQREPLAPRSKINRFFEEIERELAAGLPWDDLGADLDLSLAQLSPKVQIELVAIAAIDAVGAGVHLDLLPAEVVDLERLRRERALLKRIRKRHPRK